MAASSSANGRTNPPKGSGSAPGGTVFKGETRRDAVHRVAESELGTDVVIDEELGTYEHLYDTAEFDGVDSKHYLATAFVVTPVDERLEPDDQHALLETFTEPFPDLHPYMERYLRDLEARGYQY
ncbi:colanic acid biosynthesis protein WcaH [Natronorubrum thiooxidans]|uniref:Colanic acid biosynthesis protein WcaH n=1 Tax=Natronorubrum thiooxidans TaxID=308853 RepID=A0A1N7GDG4_9EURY|nr:NUDIX domain-containing protein [Natronorubrum thiooxidans]SIS10516.1 colanic acid biosynthesis protein WcaH [Natronorubrum thiooxidans]